MFPTKTDQGAEISCALSSEAWFLLLFIFLKTIAFPVAPVMLTSHGASDYHISVRLVLYDINYLLFTIFRVCHLFCINCASGQTLFSQGCFGNLSRSFVREGLLSNGPN